MKTTIKLTSAFMFALALLNGTDARGLTFTNFSMPLLTLNGSAASISNGTVLRLTPAQVNQAGSTFLPVALSSDLTFHSSFQFLLSNDGGAAGADGMAFVIQAAGSTALGGSGAALGYGGITPSLAVDFDTHNSNHVAFNTNGTISDPIAVAIATPFEQFGYLVCLG